MRLHRYLIPAAIVLLLAVLGVPLAAGASSHDTARHTTWQSTSHPTSQVAPAALARSGARPTIVLVHGADADSSSWSGIIRRLQRQGYPVVAFSNPLRSLAGDAQYLKDLLATIQGPIVVVGHSYGGSVMSVAAAGNSQVRSLVYIDAFLPDQGETSAELINKYPGSQFGADSFMRPFTLPGGGTGMDVYVKPGKYRELFTGPTVSRQRALVLAAEQRPIAASALGEAASAAAWRTIPSWDVIGTRDTAIPPAVQFFMAHRADARITTVPAAHVSMLSYPGVITRVIRAAAR